MILKSKVEALEEEAVEMKESNRATAKGDTEEGKENVKAVDDVKTAEVIR